ncbi:threonine ammonia-lyase, partial [Bacillus thuringiensis]|nr:threonine ammonia-lyase [Bacillus thuringiensis]
KVDSYIKGKKVVAVISGGNVDLQRISSVCEHFFVANEVK